MKKTVKHLVAPLVFLGIFGIVLSGCSSSPSQTTQTETPKVAAESKSLEEIKSNLAAIAPEAGTDASVAWEALTSPEGEYAAAASYQAVIDKFGNVEPYATILQAENRHINALTRQLERLGISVPANPYLGNLTAPTELKAAAEAWAEGEVKNVAMYDKLLTQTTDSNLLRVLNNLRRSSQESHLPAFTLAAENGGTLTADQMPAMHGGNGKNG